MCLTADFPFAVPNKERDIAISDKGRHHWRWDRRGWNGKDLIHVQSFPNLHTSAAQAGNHCVARDFFISYPAIQLLAGRAVS